MQRNVGEQRWRSHESARLPPMWSGIDAGLVPDVGRVCCWFSPSFKGLSPVFPLFPLRKTSISKFQLDWDPYKTQLTLKL